VRDRDPALSYYRQPPVTDVLAEAGMLDDDREPTVVRWFHAATADLPAPMRHELATWLDVMRNGSATPPRRQPRSDATTSTHLRGALPTLRRWATTHTSLREIGGDIRQLMDLFGLSVEGAHRYITTVGRPQPGRHSGNASAPPPPHRTYSRP
jgi:hypothetical protein